MPNLYARVKSRNASLISSIYLPNTSKTMISYLAAPGIKGKFTTIATLGNSQYIAEHVINTVSNYFRIPREKVLGTSRLGRIVMCRQIIHWYLLNKGMQCTIVGKIFGKDHSSVLHSRKVINDMLNASYDNEYKAIINELNIII